MTNTTPWSLARRAGAARAKLLETLNAELAAVTGGAGAPTWAMLTWALEHTTCDLSRRQARLLEDQTGRLIRADRATGVSIARFERLAT